MGELLQLLEQLIVAGPARNPAELERLLGLLEAFRQFVTPPASTPEPPSPAQETTGGQL